MRAEPPTIIDPLDPPVCTIGELAVLLRYKDSHLIDIVSRAALLYGKVKVPKKKLGEFREIRPPKHELRVIQRRVLDMLQAKVRYPRWMTGGVPGRSVFDHARRHVGQSFVAVLDIEKFFPSTTGAMVQAVLERFGFRDEALMGLLELCVVDNELPQGAPTSCLIANIGLDGVDRQIDAIARRHEMIFSRYIDDIAISGSSDPAGFLGTIGDLLRHRGYRVAADKRHVRGRNERQVITSLVVNDKLRPTKEFVEVVEEDIWVCLKCGPRVLADQEGIPVGRLKARLTGKVNHIFQADAKLGKKLRGRLCDVNWSGRTASAK